MNRLHHTPASIGHPPARAIALFCWLLLSVLSLHAQDFLHGYAFTSGTDRGKWKELTNPIDVGELYEDTISNTRGFDMPIGFDFNYLGTRFDIISVNNRGINFIGPSYLTEESYSFPYVSAYSFGMYAHVNVKYQLFGTPGVRVLVFEFHSTEYRFDTIWPNGVEEIHTLDFNNYYWQVQFSEVDDAITFVYRTDDDTINLTNSTLLGLVSDNGCIYLYPGNHTINADFYSTMPWMAWPGNYHYYTFTPTCPCSQPADLHVRKVDENSAEVHWNSSTRQNHAILEYGFTGFTPGRGTEIVTSDSTVLLTGLGSGVTYDVRVKTVCNNRCTSDVTSRTFKTYCVNPSGNFYFANLRDDFVKCRVGTFYNPGSENRTVDYGPDSIFSRHTVQFFRGVDMRTRNVLPVIPPNLCHSVRLGNWRPGGQQEDITYTLEVDSNEIELLILRYAIVEQNPDHDSVQMPRFTFSVLDINDQTVDACYYANFVSGFGDSNEWHQGSGTDIVWRNWSAVGFNLTNFHGQTVKLRLSNYDCAPGAHFGYAYYTLEKAAKTLTAANCGNSPVNTFYAPPGFNYRWYRGDNPSVTLSTADSLHVTTPGDYYCHVTFLGGGDECGFTLSSRSGTRYPVASFTIDSLNACGSRLRFVNNSVVATDADHTQLTDEPCESSLWRVNGVDVSTERNYSHLFDDGTHTITLVSMLGGGLCRDSVTQTITVRRDTVRFDTLVCPGRPLHVAGHSIRDTGYTLVTTECEHNLIHVRRFDTVVTELFDTVCSARGVDYFGNTYYHYGTYPWIYTDHHGCDSVILLHIRVVDFFTRTIVDTLPPGTRYAFADTVFSVPGYHTVMHYDTSWCDTLYTFFLHSIDRYDTTVCVDGLPVDFLGHHYTAARSDTLSFLDTVTGIDSLVVYTLHVRDHASPDIQLEQSCDYPPRFILTLRGDYTYRWHASPRCRPVDSTVSDTLYRLRFSPTDRTVIHFDFDYPDPPACPGSDSVVLKPDEFFSVAFDVVPKSLTTDNLHFTAIDRSISLQRREWFIDSVLQAENGAVLSAEAPPMADSVMVTLVGHHDACTDTVAHTIPILRYDVFFPNIFTPGLSTNNRFGVISTGILSFELWIFDRQGSLVFHTTDQADTWNGQYHGNGTPCPQGTYTYRCRYTTKGTNTGYQNHVGSVLLLR